MYRLLSTLAAILASLAICSCGQDDWAYLYKNLPFEMSRVETAKIPSRQFNILDFGAVGDGVFDNTQAFRNAVEELYSKGGGRLIVPSGLWFTGPIELKSHIDLHLEDNAVIIFNSQLDSYPIIDTNFEGLDTRRCESPIHAQGQHDIAITGTGVIDGSGDDWRPLKKSKVNSSLWKAKLASGGYLNEKKNIWYPDSSYLKGISLSDNNLNVPRGEISEQTWLEIKRFLRPVMISFRECERVYLQGVTFQNSPAWNIHPLLCKDVIVDGITVRNPEYSQNGDGIDIDACDGVILINSSFNVGDDGICIKSGKDEQGRERGVACRNLIVDNCTVFHGHGGFVVGSEMSGGVENIKVSNCRFLGTDVGLRFKSKRGRGGVVRNIHISDIYMKDIVTETILFDLFYGAMSAVEAKEKALEEGAQEPELLSADETTPSFRDIYINNIFCNGVDRAMYFNGLPEMRVKNINISDCTIKSYKGIEISYSEDVKLQNVSIHPSVGEPVKLSNTDNVVIL